LPFVGAKITDMLLAILSVCSEEELSEPDHAVKEPGVSAEDIQKRREEIKRKIRAVGKMQRVYQILREESENATELAINAPAPGSGSDVLGAPGATVGRSIRTFDDARRSDLLNERLPEFNTDIAPTVFGGPSMRRGTNGETEGLTMESLIKKSLEEEEGEGGVVERISEKIAKGRALMSKPPALKRHGTA